MDDYSDILQHSHHISRRHPPLSRMSRAAQFSPFAALTGYEETVEEAARLTDVRRDMDEQQLQALDLAFQRLREIGGERPLIAVTCFRPDKRKAGGAYVTLTGHFRFLDMGEGMLRLTDGRAVPLTDIFGLSFL